MGLIFFPKTEIHEFEFQPLFYDEVKDRTFYKNPSPYGCEVIIGEGTFAIMFPEDGHSPQHLVGKSEMIKKVTVKVSI